MVCSKQLGQKLCYEQLPPWSMRGEVGAPPSSPLLSCLWVGLFLILCFPQTPWNPAVDVWWQELMSSASTECEPEWCDAEDGLFILYTSGSTGKPKVCCPAPS